MIADLFINIVTLFAQLCNSLELNYISSLFKYCNLSADFLHFAAEKMINLCFWLIYLLIYFYVLFCYTGLAVGLRSLYTVVDELSEASTAV